MGLVWAFFWAGSVGSSEELEMTFESLAELSEMLFCSSSELSTSVTGAAFCCVPCDEMKVEVNVVSVGWDVSWDETLWDTIFTLGRVNTADNL